VEGEPANGEGVRAGSRLQAANTDALGSPAAPGRASRGVDDSSRGAGDALVADGRCSDGRRAADQRAHARPDQCDRDDKATPSATVMIAIGAVRIEVIGAVRIEVWPGFDRALLSEVVDALARCTCSSASDATRSRSCSRMAAACVSSTSGSIAGRFRLPPVHEAAATSIALDERPLDDLLDGIDVESEPKAPRRRKAPVH
jgi:hypothetical protein